MIHDQTYISMEGHPLSLAHLDAQEVALERKLIRQANRKPAWDQFSSYWPAAVQKFYTARGIPGNIITQTIPFQVAQDLEARLGIAGEYIRPSDCQGDLEDTIH